MKPWEQLHVGAVKEEVGSGWMAQENGSIVGLVMVQASTKIFGLPVVNGAEQRLSTRHTVQHHDFAKIAGISSSKKPVLKWDATIPSGTMSAGITFPPIANGAKPNVVRAGLPQLVPALDCLAVVS